MRKWLRESRSRAERKYFERTERSQCWDREGGWGQGSQWSRANREESGDRKHLDWQRAEPEGWKETKNQADKGWGDG